MIMIKNDKNVSDGDNRYKKYQIPTRDTEGEISICTKILVSDFYISYWVTIYVLGQVGILIFFQYKN